MTGRELASADLRVLLAELATTRQQLTELAIEIEDVYARHPGERSREVLALLAVDLHSYYTRLESMLERLLLSFEGTPARGESAHTALLRMAFLAIPGIRPAVLAESTRDGLDELRRFRHFFRHAYALDLRSDKLDRVLQPFAGTRASIDANLQAFAAFIETTLDELEHSPGRGE